MRRNTAQHDTTHLNRALKRTLRAASPARRLMIGAINVSGVEVVVAIGVPSVVLRTWVGTPQGLGHNHETA